MAVTLVPVLVLITDNSRYLQQSSATPVTRYYYEQL
jgi:hypothetical protein